MSNPLDSLVFVAVPATVPLAGEIPGFDPSIPLPVQLTGRDPAAGSGSLTRETVLAGILTVLAYDAENAHLDYYRSILRALYPSVREEMTEAAILKTRNGDFELAEEILRALRGLDPEDKITTLNLALLMDERAASLRSSGLDEDAEACEDEAFRLYRESMTAEAPIPQAFFNAGFFLLRQRNYRKAREALESYLSMETENDESAEARRERAREVVEEISARDLEDDLFKSAYDFIQMGEEETGIEKARLFLEGHPRVWNGWFLLGWGLRKLGRWEDARAAFTQALELGKEPGSGIEAGYVDLCNELAICLMELGEYAESRRWLVAALAEEGENTKVMSNLGMLAMREGKKDEAAGFFRSILEFDPKDRIAREMLESLEG